MLISRRGGQTAEGFIQLPRAQTSTVQQIFAFRVLRENSFSFKMFKRKPKTHLSPLCFFCDFVAVCTILDLVHQLVSCSRQNDYEKLGLRGANKHCEFFRSV